MVIAVDFDGTIVEHEYPKIGKPIPFALDVLKKLQQEEHHILILWTMREGRLLQEAVDYCEKNELKFYAYNKNYPEEEFQEGDSRKLAADLYIDDRNVGGLPDWGVIYKIIKSGNNNIQEMMSDMMFDYDKPKNENKNFFIRLGEAWDRARGYHY
jgi:hydroxymethylpyrimidine pyrophosphatase-like HAD family hydrolase